MSPNHECLYHFSNGPEVVNTVARNQSVVTFPSRYYDLRQRETTEAQDRNDTRHNQNRVQPLKDKMSGISSEF